MYNTHSAPLTSFEQTTLSLLQSPNTSEWKERVEAHEQNFWHNTCKAVKKHQNEQNGMHNFQRELNKKKK